MEAERERETNRRIEELQELLSSPSNSPSEPAPDDLPTSNAFGTDSVPASNSFNHLYLNVTTNMNSEQRAGALFNTNYHKKLRSYSSFPASSSAAATLSDTSSQCTNTDMMGTMYEQSLSEGDGGNHRRLRPQARQRRGSAQFTGKSQADQDFVDAIRCGPSRRSYECDVCGNKFHSPQSLGGHKNLHRSKGKNRDSRRRNRAAPVVDQIGGQGGSGSNSSESESVQSLYKGVRCREGDKWVTEIRPPKSSDKWWLGTFPSAEEAAQAYDVALAFFKSESELNFGHHPLYQKFPPLPPDLSPHTYAQRLREMVKDISEKIIAERRLSEEQAANSPSIVGPAVSPAGSSSSYTAPSTLQVLPEVPDFVTPDSPPPQQSANDIDWIRFLNFP